MALNLSVPFDYDKIDFNHLFQIQSRKSYRSIQGGRGISGVVKRFRQAVPAFLRSPVGQEITSSVANIASDISTGIPPAEAFKKAGRRTIRNLTGLGKRKQPRKSNKRSLFIPAP